MVFVQACLKGKVPGNIKNTTEITGEHHVSHVEKGLPVPAAESPLK